MAGQGIEAAGDALAHVRAFAQAFPQQFTRAVNERYRASRLRERRRLMRLAADRGLPLGVVALVLARGDAAIPMRLMALLNGGSRYMLEWQAGANRRASLPAPDPRDAEVATLILGAVDAEPTEPPIDVEGLLLALVVNVGSGAASAAVDRPTDDAPPGWTASRAPDAPRGPTAPPTTACPSGATAWALAA